jgi:hypothetical protein
MGIRACAELWVGWVVCTPVYIMVIINALRAASLEEASLHRCAAMGWGSSTSGSAAPYAGGGGAEQLSCTGAQQPVSADMDASQDLRNSATQEAK